MPIFFHMIGLGKAFLPMFIPLVTLGFFVSPVLALINGFMIPIISALLTGMPPLYPPLALIMACEGAALGGVASLAYRSLKWNVWVSLGLAIVSERIILVMAAIWIAPLFAIPPSLLSIGSLTISMPGIVLMILLVPVIVKSVNKFYTPSGQYE
jgi:hypothetical protein